MYRYEDSKVASGDRREAAIHKREYCGNSALNSQAYKRISKLAPIDPIPIDRSRRESLNSRNSNSDSNLNEKMKLKVNDRASIFNETILSKRNVAGFAEKFIELGLVLSKDMFEKRNHSSQLRGQQLEAQVMDDAIQIINCLDLYFRHSAETRISLTYLETWVNNDQIDISDDVKQTLYKFLDYNIKRLHTIPKDVTHLITGGHSSKFAGGELGMSIPESICTPNAVSISQESNIFEPFVAASVMAHMLGHNLGMEHDDEATDSIIASSATPGSQAIATYASTTTTTTTSSSPDISNNLPPERDLQTKEPKLSLKASQGSPSMSQRNRLKIEDMNEESEDRGGRSTLNMMMQVDSENDASTLNEPSDCGSNCLMSKTFAYVQSPVTLGHVTNSELVSSSVRDNLDRQIDLLHPNDDSQRLADDLTNGDRIYIEYAGPTTSTTNGPDQTKLKTHQASYSSLPFKFSSRSLSAYNRLTRLGGTVCLFNKPGHLEDFSSCGDGIKDRNEECDCGGTQRCKDIGDSCCNPITCRYRADAECVDGACCENCRLKPRGHICRKSRGECDLAELCDGKSSKCSLDIYKADGRACSNGYCYLGLCPTPDSQCIDIWGPEARLADHSCAKAFYLDSNKGNSCSNNKASSSSKRCDIDNAKCSTLFCQGGYKQPIISELSEFKFKRQSANSVASKNQSECKYITNHSVAQVRDGTKCADRKVCLNQLCVPIEEAHRDSFVHCPRDELGQDCSGHGFCTSAHRCQCEPGFAGRDCSQVLPFQSEIIQHGEQNVHLMETSTTSSSILSKMEQKLDMSLVSSPSITTEISVIQVIEPAQAVNMTSSAQQRVDTSPAPTSSQNSSSTTSTEVRKNDALGARYLVLILVTSVAAVYIGFALIANCYRRKNFYKPDKVLRHHQMSCKLESLRSSVIERRLADAKAVTSTSIDANVFNSTAPLLANDETIDFLNASNGGYLESGPYYQGSSNVISLSNIVDPNQNQSGRQDQRRISANVHYNVSDNRATVFEPDLAPLLTEKHSGSRFRLLTADQANMPNQNREARRQTNMSSFSGNPSEQSIHHRRVLMANALKGDENKFEALNRRSQPSFQHQMNRAISLGNFSNSKQRIQPTYRTDLQGSQGRSQTNLNWSESQSELICIDDVDEEDQRYGFSGRRSGHGTMLRRKSGGHSILHSTLATPVRLLKQNSRPIWIDTENVEDDSHSAPSSPEIQRFRQPWIGNEAHNQSGNAMTSYHETAILNALPRMISQRDQRVMSGVGTMSQTSRETLRRLKSDARQESLDIPDVSSEFGDDPTERLANLPPPPPPLPAEGTESEDIGSDHNITKESESMSRLKAHGTRVRVQRRIPLNDIEDQTSLIAQLQQLERVKTLHWKQHQSTNENETSLHEFFSLPLIVQLSALLARNVRDNPDDSPTRMPIDDFLNTLNNTNVANSSRKSFKRNVSSSSQINKTNQADSACSRNATLKRHPQNLWKPQDIGALIDKLQQLQELTTKNQSQYSPYDDDDDDLDVDLNHAINDLQMQRSQARGSRSDQIEEHRSRPVSRSSCRMTPARMFRDDQEAQVRRSRSRSRVSNDKISMNNIQNRAESVYSMSDSEDGSYAVTRVVKKLLSNNNSKQNSSIDTLQSSLNDDRSVRVRGSEVSAKVDCDIDRNSARNKQALDDLQTTSSSLNEGEKSTNTKTTSQPSNSVPDETGLRLPSTDETVKNL